LGGSCAIAGTRLKPASSAKSVSAFSATLNFLAFALILVLSFLVDS